MVGEVGLSFFLVLAALTPSAGPQAADELLELRGRAVCLDDGAVPRECGPGPNRFGLVSPVGKVHPFRAGDVLAGILEDARVRDQELLVRARQDPAGGLAIVKAYSIKLGKVHDVHYFCDVCNVTAYAPGLCPCCRQEMELRETPLP
jgi:hypothetical protein